MLGYLQQSKQSLPSPNCPCSKCSNCKDLRKLGVFSRKGGHSPKVPLTRGTQIQVSSKSQLSPNRLPIRYLPALSRTLSLSTVKPAHPKTCGEVRLKQFMGRKTALSVFA